MKKYLLICLLCFLISGLLLGQELREMEVIRDPEGETIPVIPTGYDESILVVKTTVPELSFESEPNPVLDVEPYSQGIYYVHLKPGSNIITFKSQGYASVQKQINIPRNEYKYYKVSAKTILIAKNPTFVLKYNPSPDERIKATLDNSLIRPDFSEGFATINAVPGKHTIKLNSGGRPWEKTFELKVGASDTFTVEFASRGKEEEKKMELGDLYITSNPPGATVYIGGSKQEKETPFTLSALFPGLYEIEVTKSFYKAQKQSIEVKAREINQVSFELIPNFGKLEIHSVPEKALVYINDKQVGTTPCKKAQFEAGTYKLKLTYPLFHDSEEITFELLPDSLFADTIRLNPQFGGLAIESNPSPSEVYLDGEPKGMTPLNLDTIPSGEHILKVKKELYKEYEEPIQIADNQKLPKSIKLKPDFAVVNFFCSPPDYRVSVSGDTSLNLNLPVKELKLKPGSYDLVVSVAGYENLELSLLLAVGDTETVSGELVRGKGDLRVSTDPQGAIIYIDKQEMGYSPKVIPDLSTGSHQITLKKDGFRKIEGEVTITSNQTVDFSQNLQSLGKNRKIKTIAFSLALPGAGQIYSGHYLRGTIYAGGLIASAILSYSSLNSYNQCKSAYQKAEDAYNQAYLQSDMNKYYAIMETEADNMNKFSLGTNIFMATAIGFYALQIVDAIFWTEGENQAIDISGFKPEDKVSLSIAPDAYSINVSLNLKFNLFK